MPGFAKSFVRLLKFPHFVVNYLLAIKYGWNFDQLTRSDSSILIEGFGGSGNSYFFTAFKYAQKTDPKIHVAGHTHHTSQVIKAVRSGIPIVIIIRNPLDAVTSLCVRGGAGDDHARILTAARKLLREYVHFYECIRGYQSSVLVADFHTIITDMNTVVLAINERFNTSFNLFPPTRDHYEACFVKWDPLRVADCNAQQKSHVKESIAHSAKLSKLLARASGLYEELSVLSSAQSQRTKSRTVSSISDVQEFSEYTSQENQLQG